MIYLKQNFFDTFSFLSTLLVITKESFLDFAFWLCNARDLSRYFFFFDS